MKYSLQISIGALAFVLIFMGSMIVQDAVTMAQDGTSTGADDSCAYDANAEQKNLYLNRDIPLEDVMTMYHERTNATFNKAIRTMITEQEQASKTNTIPKNSLPPQVEDVGAATATNAFDAYCRENPDNYSTFCLASRLLSDPQEGDGYIQYMKALNCRRNDIFDTATEVNNYQKYGQAVIFGESNDQSFARIYQQQKVMEISTRLAAVDREVAQAKRALDQTLSAYDELKTAWPMHKKYQQIYKDLVQYRDKMVEIRHQVEDYPSKFIDVTTTQCT